MTRQAFFTALAILGVYLWGWAFDAQAQTPAVEQGATLPSAWELTKAPTIGGLSLSPDGKHLAAVTSPDGISRYVSVWETANPSKPPKVLGAAKTDILGVAFIKNDRLGVRVQQLFTIGSTRTHIGKLLITDLEGKRWNSALPEKKSASATDDFRNSLGTASILNRLVDDPKHIMVLDQTQGDVYKVDVYAGAAERVSRGSSQFGGIQVDRTGQLRARSEVNFENGNIYLAVWLRSPVTGAWEEHFRSFAKNRNLVDVVGFTKDPNIIYIAKRPEGGDKTQVFEYDIAARKILEPVFAHKLFDASGPVFTTAGDLVGFGYRAEKGRTYWTDDRLASIAKSLEVSLKQSDQTVAWTDTASGALGKLKYAPDASVDIIDWSDDLKYIVVQREGPSLPPEYYLLTDGSKLSLLGWSRPNLDLKAIGPSRLVQYTARDGLVIPAFLHLPPEVLYGKGPYRAIVLPHGGPSARDNYSWDVSSWTTYFTSRGYVVIQPQFRGSVGWGEKLARAGDAQWGKTMQDDNDDAAKWLVVQGYADKNRMALFGYSYGGYTGYLAAIRPNGLYQCSVAGAGVAQIKRFQGETYDNRFLREYQRPTIDGVDPLSNVDKVSIPIFVYHGDRDQVVIIEESRKFVAALKAAGKSHKYLELPDMGHTFNTWGTKDGETQLLEIEKFFKTECKPGGL
jgi:dipeptidyl aminopeptidase/acylaminoacyl peptidase